MKPLEKAVSIYQQYYANSRVHDLHSKRLIDSLDNAIICAKELHFVMNANARHQSAVLYYEKVIDELELMRKNGSSDIRKYDDSDKHICEICKNKVLLCDMSVNISGMFICKPCLNK